MGLDMTPPPSKTLVENEDYKLQEHPRVRQEEAGILALSFKGDLQDKLFINTDTLISLVDQVLIMTEETINELNREEKNEERKK